jgi:large subunit ribosomal protein L22
MEVKAVAKYVRVQPRKVRIVADKVRGMNAQRSATVLRFHKSKAAQALRKVLVSAIANAEANHGLSGEILNVATIMVDEGPRIKRIQARAMGRAYRIVKKTSHITVVVEEGEAPTRVKATGTKPKPRPTFGEGKKAKPKPKAKPEATLEEPIAEEAASEAPVEEQAAVEAESPIIEESQEAAETVDAEPVDEPVSEDAEANEESSTGEDAGDGEEKKAE